MRAVLCDDLTGAFDVAEHAVDLAPSIRVVPRPDDPALLDAPCDLLVVSTGTRDLPPEDAAARVRGLHARLAAAKVSIFFKKTDSTLRGAIRAEFAALPRPRGGILFVPAHPALSRTVVGGRLFVDGIPVETTAFGRDPAFPRGASRVADLLPEGDGECPDVREPADLDRLARRALDRGMLPAGSSGFFRALARIAFPEGASRVARGGYVPASPILFLNGSRNPVSAADEGRLLARGARSARIDEPFPVAGDLVIATRDVPGYAGLPPFAANLRALFSGGRFATAVVSGGATLASLLELLGPSTLTLAGSVAPGVPAVACVHKGGAFTLVPKPGGFTLHAAPATPEAASQARKADAT